MRTAVLSHRAIAHELGLIEPWLEDVSGGDITRIYREDGLPAAVDADLLVVMGSPTSIAVGHESDAGLAELALVRDWVATDRPYLGLCFGAQVLARATGGTVTRMATTYRSYAPLPIDASVSAALAGPWVLWHEDAITAPAQATVLSTLPHADIAFRIGHAVGLQPHVEVTSDSLERMLQALGVAPEQYESYVSGLRDQEQSAVTPADRMAALLHDLSPLLLG